MQTDSEQERQHKILLFWVVYLFDTSFSIRLGRTPLIRDHEITVPMIAQNGTFPNRFVEVLSYWIGLGKIQCEAVERLYTPSAQQQPLEERQRCAERLVMRLQETWNDRSQVNDSSVRLSTTRRLTALFEFQSSLKAAPSGPNAPFLTLLEGIDSIMHYSTL